MKFFKIVLFGFFEISLFWTIQEADLIRLSVIFNSKTWFSM